MKVLAAAGHSGERERERGERREVWLAAEIRGKAVFFLDFGPKFPPPRSMKIKPIYRKWKMDTLSLLSALGSTRKHLNHWFKVAMMNC